MGAPDDVSAFVLIGGKANSDCDELLDEIEHRLKGRHRIGVSVLTAAFKFNCGQC